MEEHFQVGPYIVDVLLARNLKHTHQHAEHPRRDAGEIGDVLLEAFVRYAVALHLEVGEQGCLLLRHTDKIDERTDVLDEDGTKVADERLRHVVVGRVRSAQYQSLSVEHSALGIVLQVERHDIRAALVVYVLQTLLRHGNELTLVVGGA